MQQQAEGQAGVAEIRKYAGRWVSRTRTCIATNGHTDGSATDADIVGRRLLVVETSNFLGRRPQQLASAVTIAGGKRA
jgi:hypothetical protein